MWEVIFQYCLPMKDAIIIIMACTECHEVLKYKREEKIFIIIIISNHIILILWQYSVQRGLINVKYHLVVHW